MVTKINADKLFEATPARVRTLIDGKKTGSCKCCGYCRYDGHPGYLDEKYIRDHMCVEKGCHYFIAKPAKEKIKNEITYDPAEQIFAAASDITEQYEGMKITGVSAGTGNEYELRYVTISNYPIKCIEEAISNVTGIRVVMKNIACDFDRAQKIIFGF